MDDLSTPQPLWSYSDIGYSAWLLKDIPAGVLRSPADSLPYAKTYLDGIVRSVRQGRWEIGQYVARPSMESDQIGTYGQTYIAIARDIDVISKHAEEAQVRRLVSAREQKCGANLLSAIHQDADKKQPVILSAGSLARISADWSAELRAKVKASEEKRRLDSRILVDIQDLD